MKKHLLELLLAGVVLFSAACDSQRSSTTAETTTTAEKVTADQVPPPDTTTTQETTTDSGEISAEKAASGAFVSEPEFVAKAIESGMAEVKFGHLADRKAIDPDVKKFGIQMVQDHTNANAVLMRLSKNRKWVTPDDMDVAHQQAYSKLATVMSDEFDQGYMAQMVEDHEMAVALYQNAANQVTDAELKSYINNTLPALRKHLGMARDLQKKIEANR